MKEKKYDILDQPIEKGSKVAYAQADQGHSGMEITEVLGHTAERVVVKRTPSRHLSYYKADGGAVPSMRVSPKSLLVVDKLFPITTQK